MRGVDPNHFFTIGDIDHWSSSDRSSDIDYDSTLRKVRRGATNNNIWRSIAGRGKRNPAKGSAFVAEFATHTSIAGLAFDGLVLEGSVSALLATYAGSIAGSVGWQDSGAIYLNAALVASGLATHAAGGRFSIALYRETGGTLKARGFINGRRNVLGYTEAFDNAAWAIIQGIAAKTADAASAPPDFDPVICGRAEKLVETAGVVENHYVEQAIGNIGAGIHSYSCYLKADRRGWAWLTLAVDASVYYCYFNIAAGTIGTATGATGTMTAVGGGWYRCSIQATTIAGAAVVRVGLGSADNVSAYAGTAGFGILVWGAQLEAGALTAYQRQVGASGGYTGVPVTLTDGDYRLAWSGYQDGQTGAALPDRDDQVFFAEIAQAGIGVAQPWGAAARVADAGGYSPNATVLRDKSAAFPTLDTFARVASTTAAAWDMVRADKARSSTTTKTGPQFVWAEFVCLTAVHLMLGLHKSGTLVISYPGVDANGWGFYPHSAQSYHAGVATALAGGGVAVNDRIAVLWDRWNGKVWWGHITAAGVLTFLGGGNPELGTGAQYSNVTGTLCPAGGVNTGGNPSAAFRLCAHAGEMLAMPNWVEAWDGSDLLPSRHYRDRLSGDTEISMGVGFAAISSGGSDSPSPIGPIELMNEDGLYDALTDFRLRDQAVAVDRVWDDIPEAEARGLIDSVSLPNAREVRIVVRDRLTRLDRRVGQELLAIGTWQTLSGAPVPCVPVPNYPDAYNFCDTPFTSFTLTSVGQVEPDWIRGDADRVRGFVRTDAIVGRQGIRALKVRANDKSFRVANWDFAAWAADDPSSWAVANENGTTAFVTQVGSAARLVRNVGAPALQISQASACTGYNKYMVRLKVSAYVAGTVRVQLGAISVSANITSTGNFYVLFDPMVAGTLQTLLLEATDGATGCDLNLDEVEIYGLRETDTAFLATQYVLRDLGGLGPSDYVLTQPAELFSNVAYFSKANPTIRQVMRDLLNGWLADAYTDEAGVIRFAWLDDPERYSESSPLWLGEITENDLFEDLTVADVLAPRLSDQMISGYNFNQHSETDIVGAVASADRIAFVREYFASRYAQPMNPNPAAGTARPFHAFYAHALGAPPLPRHRYITSTPDPAVANTDRELWRLHEWARDKRRAFGATVSLEKVRRWRPGGFLRLKNSRYGLSAGRKVELLLVKRSAPGTVAKLLMIG